MLPMLLALTGPLRAAAPGEPLVEALRQRVEALRAGGDAQIGAGSIAARTLVAALYERRGFAPLWSDPARARSLREAIAASATHGLDPRDYHADQLAAPAASAGDDAEGERAAHDPHRTVAHYRR